ncbi:MAG: helix-turn-helix domain-containing protein [Dehalococcoidia bacterium]
MYRERKHSVDEICEIMGITKPTLYRYVGDSSRRT